MNDPNLFTVIKEEVHYLPCCNCSACTAEKARRDESQPRTPIKRISVNAAHLMGIISHRSPHGSVARNLAKQIDG